MASHIITVKGPLGTATVQAHNAPNVGMTAGFPARTWHVLSGRTLRHQCSKRADAVRAAFTLTGAPRFNVPNLDGEPNLLAWIKGVKLRDVVLCPRDDEALIFHRLGQYARNLMHAREHRLAGRIERACAMEARCDRLYAALPDEARW